MVYATQVVIDGEAIWGNARGIKPYVKATLQDAVRYWHRKYIKRHFRSGAAERYGYKKRSAKYVRRKLRAKHHSSPLVWTGRTRDSVSSHIRVSGTAKQATGRMVAPWYIKMVPSTRNAPNLGDEIARTTEQEERDVRRYMERVFAERIRKHRTRKVVKI